MADDNTNADAAAQRLAAERTISDRSRREYEERMQGKPTPTQEENDRSACGEHIHVHEYDGSALDPTRHMEGGPAPAPYQTRQSAAGRPAPAKPRTE